MVQKFNNMISRLNIKSVIELPTRQNAILTNNHESVVETGILCPSLSDHDACYLVRKCKQIKPKTHTIVRRNYEKMDMKLLGSEVVNSVFDCEGDLDSRVNFFMKKHIYIFDKAAPITTQTITYSKKPILFSEKTIELLKQRKIAMKKCKQGNLCKLEYKLSNYVKNLFVMTPNSICPTRLKNMVHGR